MGSVKQLLERIQHGRAGTKQRYYLSYTLLFLLACGIVFYPFYSSDTGFVWLRDGISQHYPRLMYIRDWIREIGKGLFQDGQLQIPVWDFSIGFGQSLFNLTAFDPLRFLAALVPKQNMELLYEALVFIRLYLAGLAFSFYGKKKGLASFPLLAGSLLYAFSGYALYFLVRHPSFGNPLIALPLLLLGIDKIFRKERSWLFVGVIAFFGMNSYYYLYMLTIFGVLYGIGQYVLQEEKKSVVSFLKTLGRFAGRYLLGIGISAVVLLPMLLLHLSSGRSGGGSSIPLLHSISYYWKLFSGFLSPEFIGYQGYIVCSGITFLVLVLLFIRKKGENGRNERMLKVSFLILTAIFAVPMLGSMLNGFSYVSNRWAFAYAFFGAFAAACLLPRLFTVKKADLTKLSAVVLVYCLIGLFVPQIRDTALLSSCVFLLFYLVFCFLIAVQENNKDGMRSVQVLFLVFILLETGINGILIYEPQEGGLAAEFAQQGTAQEQIETPLIQALNKVEDDSIYRVDVLPVTNANYGLGTGFGGISSYLSLSGKEIVSYADALGISERLIPFHIDGFDDRTALNTLASVKYIAVDEAHRSYVPYGYEQAIQNKKPVKIQQEDGSYVRVYKNKYALPLFYTYDTYMKQETYDSLPVNRKEQAMLSSIVLEEKQDALTEDMPSFTDRTILTSEQVFQQIEETYSGKEAYETLIEVGENCLIVKGNQVSINLTFDGLSDAETYLSLENFRYEPVNPTTWKSVFLGPEGTYTRLQEQEFERKYSSFHMETTSDLTLKCGSVQKAYTARPKDDRYYMGVRDLLFQMGYQETQADTIKLTFEKPGIYYLDSMQVINQPMDGYAQKVNRLNADQIEGLRIENNEIRGTVTLDANKALCIGVPYSSGFRAWVDGKESEILHANGMYMALMPGSGTHEIVVRYEAPGLKAGALISLGSIILAAMCLVAARLRNRKRNCRSQK